MALLYSQNVVHIRLTMIFRLWRQDFIPLLQNMCRRSSTAQISLTVIRKTTVGFALTILQRRLASSPEAIYQSLKRRRERLENRLLEERLGKRATEYATTYYYDDYDDDDMPSAELEDIEEIVVDQASAAQTISELEAEIETLKRLERMANDVRQSGEDRKWDELSKLLQDDDNMFGNDGMRKN